MSIPDDVVRFNMNGAPPTLAMLAAIATQLEMHGSLLITNAAVSNTPGLGSLMLGRVMDRFLAEMQKEAEAAMESANSSPRIIQ